MLASVIYSASKGCCMSTPVRAAVPRRRRPRPCDACVMLTYGANSKALTSRLGARVPLDVELGYHALLPAHGLQLPAQLLDGEGKYALTSMQGGVRLAGSVEQGLPYGLPVIGYAPQ